MGRKYIDLLKNISEKERRLPKLNDNILIVDGNNTFMRAFAKSSITNDNGEPIGGYSGFLLSMGYAIKRISPTRVIVVFDGKNGSKYRKELFHEYKANRKKRDKPIHSHLYTNVDEEEQNKEYQLSRLIDYLLVLPVQPLAMDYVEADDVIAYFCTEYDEFKESKIHIMSTDQDFLQLINDRINVYNPKSKDILTKNILFNKYQINNENIVLIKSITGDTSDNVPGIKGSGIFDISLDKMKNVRKYLSMLFTEEIYDIDKLINSINGLDKKYKLHENILNNRDSLDLNLKLIQLNESILNKEQKIIVNNSLQKEIPSLNKLEFLSMLRIDQMNHAIKNPINWLDECFYKLNNLRKKL